MLEELIWKAMLDADMNARYWQLLARRYARWDRNTKILLALTASGAVAGWGIWTDIPKAWKVLSGLSAILAIALPFLDWSTHVERMSTLRGQWEILQTEYELLLLRCDQDPPDPQIQGRFEQLRRQERTSGATDSRLPESQKLLAKAYDQVVASRYPHSEE